ncbi:hypothetical protein WN55_11049 [Dufourea novaeangliae]|uniref:Uncharacterized protein n=1 Tax=Dufourea novaeangliae TaxID=178035 RepID=A0A154PBM9_DUFNO|nr:hypothetical protein WN55_11049 [Dufourea novaeangliae]
MSSHIVIFELHWSIVETKHPHMLNNSKIGMTSKVIWRYRGLTINSRRLVSERIISISTIVCHLLSIEGTQTLESFQNSPVDCTNEGKVRIRL